MGLLPSLPQSPRFSFSFPVDYVCRLPFSLLVSLCALGVRHQCITASAILKYGCALVFAVSLPFCSLWHLRGISAWSCARLSPSHYKAQAQLTAVREPMLFSLSFRCLPPFNPSALRRLAELGVFVTCRDNDKRCAVHVRAIPRRDKVELCERNGLRAILANKDDRYWCWGIVRQGGDEAKTQNPAAIKKRFPQHFL